MLKIANVNNRGFLKRISSKKTNIEPKQIKLVNIQKKTNSVDGILQKISLEFLEIYCELSYIKHTKHMNR